VSAGVSTRCPACCSSGTTRSQVAALCQAPWTPLGDLEAYQWRLLLASHTERHVQQIEAVKTASGYPS